MINGYDIVYGLALGLGAPYWLLKPSARRKVLSALRQRMGRNVEGRTTLGPKVMIHAVSVGEVNATPALVKALREARGDVRFVISTTTNDGFARATELYGDAKDVARIRYPLDFSCAINRVLRTMRPSVVVLMELEVWPNFIRRCEKLNIPVALINGRLTASSFRGYRMLKWAVKRMFTRLSAVCVQDKTYADRFLELGANPDRVKITGTMKFDTAELAEKIAGADELASSLALKPGEEPIWVCGSTGPGEEEIILRVYRSLLTRWHRLRLVIVPRKRDRFDEVAKLIEQMKFRLIRRTLMNLPTGKQIVPPVILGDTMGELRKFYSVADVVFVGRSLVDLGPRQHGSDMIEPAALGKPVLTGRFTANFAEAMARFRDADAMLEVADESELMQGMSVMLSSPDQAALMGFRAQEVVREQQGATGRHVQVILDQLRRVESSNWPAIMIK